MRAPAACALALLLLAPGSAPADGGKWTPQQVLELGEAWVREQGFTLPLDRLWDARTGDGLLANAVELPGCSGAFVSAEGLLVTNHHCVVGILQQHSTPQANLGRDGFLARQRSEEKRAKAYRIHVPRAFRDVTERVLAAVPKGASDLERFQAVEAQEKTLVAECEKTPSTRCDFAAFDDGLSFALFEREEIDDVRLVYAPPLGVGDYGGEVDNWSWPRHTGDFALLRAYGEDGQPYRPRQFFPPSTEGVREGDAVAVLGYPGRSYRSWTAAEMAERRDRYFPAVMDLYGEWVDLLQRAGATSPEVAIAVESELRSYENARKNAEGQIAGLRRGRTVERRAEAEERLTAWVRTRPEGPAALAARAGLLRLAEEKLATWERDFLLDRLTRGPWALRWPVRIARRAVEAAKPDALREPGFQERDLPKLRDELERDQSRYAPAADAALLRSWVRRALALPAGQRMGPVDALFAGLDEAERERRLEALVATSRVFDLAERRAMFEETEERLRARKDPLLDLGLALDAVRREVKAREDAASGAKLRLRPVWRRAEIAEAGKPVAFDANSTLRVTFGRVRGYSPREAVVYLPQTTLAGALAKHTGKDPFDLPARVRAAAEAGRTGRWREPGLPHVPVAFLATCDTTGGNSGSPVVDGRGRLVGVNFDRVWENVANDFGYDPAVARNVGADVRYLLWLLEEVEGATELLRELGVPPVSPGTAPAR